MKFVCFENNVEHICGQCIWINIFVVYRLFNMYTERKRFVREWNYTLFQCIWINISMYLDKYFVVYRLFNKYTERKRFVSWMKSYSDSMDISWTCLRLTSLGLYISRNKTNSSKLGIHESPYSLADFMLKQIVYTTHAKFWINFLYSL